MANVQHSSLQSADVHEPKHITGNGTSATGQVITNSSSTGGESEYRRLKMSDVTEVEEIISMMELTSTTVQTHYFAMPFAGTVESWYLVVNNALTTASNTWEVQIDGVQVTGTPITMAISGAAGDNATAAATAANSFAAGANVMVVGTTIGNADASVDTRFMITVRRS